MEELERLLDSGSIKRVEMWKEGNTRHCLLIVDLMLYQGEGDVHFWDNMISYKGLLKACIEDLKRRLVHYS